MLQPVLVGLNPALFVGQRALFDNVRAAHRRRDVDHLIGNHHLLTAVDECTDCFTGIGTNLNQVVAEATVDAVMTPPLASKNTAATSQL